MIYLVSGRIRSGTSMMMRASMVGGMDGKYLHLPKKVVDYDPNPHGYFEGGFNLAYYPEDHDNRVAKCFARAIVNILPAQIPVKVVFMLRDDAEILSSYNVSFGPDSRLEITDGPETIDRLQEDPQVDLMVINYTDMIADPIGQCQRLADWGWPMWKQLLRL